MKYVKLVSLLTGIFITSSSFSATAITTQKLQLEKQPGFFRFSFDEVKMPQSNPSMGLLGINYFLDITPHFYGGIGGYGSITGNQGGLFVLGFGGGFHQEIFPHWWGDAGLYLGGGGGRSSLVGGGLMIRPHIGIAYSWQWARLGLHYSYIDFPSGQIKSSQLGLDLDIPWDFYYIPLQNSSSALFTVDTISLPLGNYLNFQRNDFALLLQAYRQKSGTTNVNGVTQDGTISLVGAELDHYLTEKIFWYIKAAGAYAGNPNGYMDLLGGFGYHQVIESHGLALVPQFGLGAGGGGNTDTGGGVLIQPQLGVEVPLTTNFAARVSGGYIWAPKGNLNAFTATGEIIYHLDMATASSTPKNNLANSYSIQKWRIQLFNQTYLSPQRISSSTTSAINLVAVQIDQFFTPTFLFSYQAASAYQGEHAGGYATGMIGPGLQTPGFFNNHLQFYTEVLIGAGGGGGLALGGGALIEPVIGLHYNMTPATGIIASVSQLKALHNSLNTTVVNIGLTLNFGMLEKNN